MRSRYHRHGPPCRPLSHSSHLRFVAAFSGSGRQLRRKRDDLCKGSIALVLGCEVELNRHASVFGLLKCIFTEIGGGFPLDLVQCVQGAVYEMAENVGL